jgi:hypothetical protein
VWQLDASAQRGASSTVPSSAPLGLSCCDECEIGNRKG